MLSLVYQPITYFQRRLSRPPSWRLALGGPLGCAGLAVASHAVFTAKIAGPILDALTELGASTAFVASLQYMGILSAALTYVVIWLSASAFLIAFDVLWRQSDDLSRILETNGLAFYSQLPWLVALIAAAAVFEPPAVFGVPSGPELERFRRLLEQDPFLAAVRTANECFTVWLYGLFGAGYHAVTGCALWQALLLTWSMCVAFHLLRYAL